MTADTHLEAVEPCFECGSTERMGTACAPCNPEMTDPSFGMSPPAGEGQWSPIETAFGFGKIVVGSGLYGGRPAVFICPVCEPGEIGARADLGHDRNSLQPGEQVLTFPTLEQAKAVADALVNAPPAPSPRVEKLEERRDWRDAPPCEHCGAAIFTLHAEDCAALRTESPK